MTETYWFPEDKAWMKARKEQWRRVKFNLDVISKRNSEFKRSYHKYHQELFFKGTINEGVLEGGPSEKSRYHEISGDDAFMWILPIFRIWYHPQPEVLDLDQMREEFRAHGSLARARERFFGKVSPPGSGGDGMSFDPQYGPMGGGGREVLAVRFVCPGLDYQEELPPVGGNRHGEPPCDAPDRTCGRCRAGTQTELQHDATFFPYAAGQYLWDHMDYALSHYYDEIVASTNHGEAIIRNILIVMAEVLGFEERTDPSRNRPSTIDMVQRLITRYEAKDFSDPVLQMWDSAKKDIEALREQGREDEMFGTDEKRVNQRFRARGGYPIKKQREWRAKWAQV